MWVQDKGGGRPLLRGTVLIEDLSPVLTCISSRSGANGPLSPVTQYILQEAANYLAERLVASLKPHLPAGVVHAVEVAVHESPGQGSSCELHL